MAAGLGFKTFTTGEVLTAGDVNGYLMQGVLVFASAAARDAAITSPQEGQFAFLKDTNVTTYYTGSAWTNLDTTGMTNPMTTTGDTIYSSPGSTPVRLGIGSTGNVLTVAGGVPTWSAPAAGGGMTLLSTTTLSGASTTISSISGSYKSLVAYIYGVNMASNGTLGIAPNNSSSVNAITNYAENGSAYAIATNNGNISTPGSMVQNNVNNAFTLQIDNYANSTNYKPFQFYGLYKWSSWTTAMMQGGAFQSNTAITSLDFYNSGGNFTTGTVLLYGVN
jgi:hypothetical protein